MKNTALLLMLLVALCAPSAAQEVDEAKARYNVFLQTLQNAKTLQELKPFYSQDAWGSISGKSSDVKAQILGLVVLRTAYAGTRVTGAKQEGAKVRIDTETPHQGRTIKGHTLMVSEHGAWVMER